MKLHLKTASLFIPDGHPEEEALARTTHLGIGAHPDDLEFMAFHGIAECFQKPDRWFGGVTCTNGAGSPRLGAHAKRSDEEMIQIRRKEQNEAARIGEYSFVAQLDYPSAAAKDPSDGRLADDLRTLLSATRPEVVYTHNPADRHATHVAVAVATLHALRALPAAGRPSRVLGCEMWGSLDWLPDRDKVALNVSGNQELAEALLAVFASQIAGGKRYDLAVVGRRRANATFLESHAADAMQQAWFAMDLTPLVADDRPDVVAHVQALMQRFADEVTANLRRRLG